LGKFRGYINRDKPRKESVVQENNEEVFETSDIDGDTVDVRRSDIRNPEIEQETSEEISLLTKQKQLGTSLEADSHTLDARIGQVKAKFKAENQSLEDKFSQVFGELSERMRQQNIRVERGTKGFGLSLIYKGLDRYHEDETGVFVAKIVPGGQSQRAGLKENDKILKINNKVPSNVNDAVHCIKKAGRNLLLTIERRDATEETGNLSRTGSVRSFNTAYGGNQSRPQSPGGYSSGYEDEEEARRQARQLEAQQAELEARQMAMAEEERRLQAQKMEQERVRQRLEAEKIEQQRIYHQQQQQQMYQQQQQQQQMYQQQQQQMLMEERRRQAEEEERQRKLQADLDLAAANAGRGRSQRRYDSEDEDSNYGGHHARSKSLDARKTPRSKSPGAWSGISGISVGDLPELSRTEEKEAMKTNNNKLANYIDNVRRLQNENSKMIKQIEVIESSQTKEISDLREIYDREIGDLKSAIKRMQDNYKDLQANSERVLTENMDLKKMQEKKIQDYEKKQRAIPLLREEVQKLKNRIESCNNSHEKAKQQLKEVLPEYGKLKERLYEVTRQHQDAKQEREDLESQCKNLSSDLQKKIKEMEVAVHEVKYKKQVDVTAQIHKLETEYDSRMQQTLAELRDFYETQMKNNRAEFTRKYEDKVGSLQNLLSKERARNSSNSGEHEEAQRRIHALVQKVQKLESENFELNKNVEKIINNIEDQKKKQQKELIDKDAKIEKTMKDIRDQMEAYQELMQVKTALDMEIAVYKQLLETEEDRLGITPENGLNDSFDLGSDEESDQQGGRSKITYKMTVSTENLSEHRRSMAQTQI